MTIIMKNIRLEAWLNITIKPDRLQNRDKWLAFIVKHQVKKARKA